MQPFDSDWDQNVLVSFSTGFFSRSNDQINAENELEVGLKIQTKLEGDGPTRKLEEKKGKSEIISNVMDISFWCGLHYPSQCVEIFQPFCNLCPKRKPS